MENIKNMFLIKKFLSIHVTLPRWRKYINNFWMREKCIDFEKKKDNTVYNKLDNLNKLQIYI